jgi:hypothetical protein
MNQREFHHAIARVTGESLHTVERLKFSLLDWRQPFSDTDGPALTPQIVDWDQLTLTAAPWRSTLEGPLDSSVVCFPRHSNLEVHFFPS